MIDIVKILSSSFDDKMRQIRKILRLGKDDIQTSFESGPFGLDSNPVKDMQAIYASTGEKGDTVIIGYIKTGQAATVGQTRLYSTDTDGNENFVLLLKGDGTAEFGGNTKHMVRFEELKAAFDDLQGQWNTFAAAYVPGSPVLQGTPPTAVQSTIFIDPAKIDEIKTL